MKQPESGKPTLFRLMPSIGDFAWLMPVLIMFGRMNGARTLLADGDTGWHIQTGEWILANGRVPHVDVFSFTKAGQAWYAWEWLSDVLMGWLHHVGGMQAVVLAGIVLLCLTFALLYRLIRRQSASVLIAFAVTAIAAWGSSIHWLARPHLFTMLFLVVFYSILEERRMRLLFILPFATIIWTNLHGGFLVGILVICVYAAGEFITALLATESEGRRDATGRGWRYVMAALGCLLASFINPYGWHLHAQLIRFLTNPAYFRNVAEFVSINFRHPLAPYFELMLLLGVATALWSVMRRRFVALLLLVGFAHLALLAARNIPLFMIVAAPPVGLALAEWLRLLEEETAGSTLKEMFSALNSLSERLNAADAGPHWHVVGPVAVIMIGVLMYGRTPTNHFQAEYDPHMFPAKALATLRDSDRVFTSDTWGSYLIYRRHPTKVFVDGRWDFYGPEMQAEFETIFRVQYNWEATLAAHDIDTVLLSVQAPLCGAMKGSRNWQAVYDDGMAIVFRAAVLERPAVEGSAGRHAQLERNY